MNALPDNTDVLATRRLVGDAGQTPKHVTVITTDEPVRVEVGGAPSGRWFKLWFCLVESGAWASFSPAAAKVLVVLAKWANGHPDLACWPGVPTIARDAGLSRSAVFGAISELVDSGWVLRRTVGGGGSTTTYQLTEPRGSGRRLQPPPRSAPLPAPRSAPTSDRPTASISAPHSASISAHVSGPLSGQLSGSTSGSPSARDRLLTPGDHTRPSAPPQRVLGEYELSALSGHAPDGGAPVQPAGPPPSSLLDPPRPACWTPPVQQDGLDLEIRKNKKNSSSARAEDSPAAVDRRTTPDAAAAAMLSAEGFGAADVARLAAHGLQRVTDAVDNCNSLAKAGRLRGSRRGFIARAIVDGYSLYEGVEKSRIPAAARRLPAVVRPVATPEELEQLNQAYPSPASIEALFRRGVLRPADVDAMNPEALLRKLLGAAR